MYPGWCSLVVLSFPRLKTIWVIKLSRTVLVNISSLDYYRRTQWAATQPLRVLLIKLGPVEVPLFLFFCSSGNILQLPLFSGTSLFNVKFEACFASDSNANHIHTQMRYVIRCYGCIHKNAHSFNVVVNVTHDHLFCFAGCKLQPFKLVLTTFSFANIIRVTHSQT